VKVRYLVVLVLPGGHRRPLQLFADKGEAERVRQIALAVSSGKIEVEAVPEWLGDERRENDMRFELADLRCREQRREFAGQNSYVSALCTVASS